MPNALLILSQTMGIMGPTAKKSIVEEPGSLGGVFIYPKFPNLWRWDLNL
jgi:hypothetical protein